MFSCAISGPPLEEVQAAVKKSVHREMFAKQYAEVFEGDAAWSAIKVPAGDLYAWDEASTYIKRAPYFDDMADPKTYVKICTGCVRWPCWAIPSPPITSRPPATSPSTVPRENI